MKDRLLTALWDGAVLYVVKLLTQASKLIGRGTVIPFEPVLAFLEPHQQHPYVQKHETLLSSVCECFALQPDYSREITMTPEEQIVKMTTAIRQAIKVMADRFGSNEEDVAKAIRELKASLQTA